MLLKYTRKNSIWLSFALVYLFLVVANSAGFSLWLPPCLITAATGHECFGCGLSRALIYLLQGDVVDAAKTNFLVFIYIPAFLIFLISDYSSFIKYQEQKA